MNGQPSLPAKTRPRFHAHHTVPIHVRVGKRGYRSTTRRCPRSLRRSMQNRPSSGGRCGGTSGCDCGSPVNIMCNVWINNAHEGLRPWSYRPTAGDFNSCHTKSIRGNPCSPSRLMEDKGTKGSTNDVVRRNRARNKCWRAPGVAEWQQQH